MQVCKKFRLLLVVASINLGIGAWMHSARTGAVFNMLANAGLQDFEHAGFRALWHSDTCTQVILAIICGWLSYRPASASRAIVLLLSLLPFSTAIALYSQLGYYSGAHTLMVSTLLIAAASLGFPKSSLDR